MSGDGQPLRGLRETLAPMGEGDLPEVLAIEAASFPRPWTEDAFRAELARPFARCLVVREGAAPHPIVAHLVFWILAGEAQLLNVAVRPDRRGGGLGRRLVSAVIAAAREAEAERVTLEVRRSNAAAVGLYRALGFAVVAVRAGYYQDNGEDALVMECDPRATRGDEVGHAPR